MGYVESRAGKGVCGLETKGMGGAGGGGGVGCRRKELAAFSNKGEKHHENVLSTQAGGEMPRRVVHRIVQGGNTLRPRKVMLRPKVTNSKSRN